jgi:polyhydroxyalkanoate synthesis regulator phasin
MSGATWFRYKREAKRIEKDLKEVDKSLDLLHEVQADWNRAHPQPTPGLTEEFSPAAKRQIDALKARLEELEKQVDKVVAENDKSIDKPKFKPPAGPK